MERALFPLTLLSLLQQKDMLRWTHKEMEKERTKLASVGMAGSLAGQAVEHWERERDRVYFSLRLLFFILVRIDR